MDTQKAKGGSGQDDAPIRVLLLEDDACLRERFADIIRAWPAAQLVAACACLAEARQVLQEQPVDLLLTDLQLPDGHGTEAIRLLQQINPAADSVVISVLADDETVIDAIEAGRITADTPGRHPATDTGKPLNDSLDADAQAAGER